MSMFKHSTTIIGRFLLNKCALQQIGGVQHRAMKRWVAPTLKELQRRRNKLGPQAEEPRSTFLEWNYDAEIFAFGKRLGEDFNKTVLKQALTQKEYANVQELKAENTQGVKLDDNYNFISEGGAIIEQVIKEHYKKYPNDVISSVVKYLTTTQVLAKVAKNIGLKDIVLTNEFPVEDETLANTFKAIISALKKSSENRVELFVKDFLITQLNGKDLLEIWDPQEPYKVLNDLIVAKDKNCNLEPRLCNESATNTILANYQVGIYNNKKLLGIEISNYISDNNESPRAADLSHLGDKVFGKPNEESGKILETWDPKMEINPEELGKYAEGDILVPNPKTKNGLVAKTARWKDGIIPYEINGYFRSEDLKTIHKAMGIYHKYTCVRFRERTSSDNDYISIVNGPTGCWSSVGRITGKQEVNLQSPYCTTKVGTPLHELMHAIGFMHEQNRWERDDFVNIMWNNIKKGHDSNFDKAFKDTTNGYGVKYDYSSVMHYSGSAFSSNGKPTIVAKTNGAGLKMGQRDGLSRGDLIKINAMYNCPNDIPGGSINNNGVDYHGATGPNNNNNNLFAFFAHLFSD